MPETVLLAGTRKGLFIGRSDVERREWRWDTPVFAMEEIYSAAIDDRGSKPRLLVGSTSWHYGPMVYRSDDLGLTWDESHTGTIRMPEGTDASIERVWQLQPSPADGDVVWAGTQPSALFRSDDRGETFTLVRSLWDHPHRTEWGEGFGGQAIHTIVPHPYDPDVVTVAMSTGGVYRSHDGGGSWQPRNRGITMDFVPGEAPEFGQCVHKVAVDAGDPDRLYAESRRRVPLRRRGTFVGADRRRSARRLRLPDRRASASSGRHLRVPADQRRGALLPGRQAGGLAVRRCGGVVARDQSRSSAGGLDRCAA